MLWSTGASGIRSASAGAVAPFLFPKGGKGKNPLVEGEQNGIGRVAQNRDQKENTRYPQAVEKHFVMFIKSLIYVKNFSVIQPVEIL